MNKKNIITTFQPLKTGEKNLSNIIIGEIFKNSQKDVISHTKKILQICTNGYGYGDKIAGTKVPILRKIAKKNKNIPLPYVEKLLKNKIHEARFVALVILIENFQKHIEEVFQIYISNTKFINNWDLVDISAHHIVGEYCIQKNNTETIWNFANSKDLWENRIAIISSWAFIKKGDVSITIKLAKHLMNHDHHLIHKAIGWMLREVGKRDQYLLINFLKIHKKNLPKITYSYATEKIKLFL